MDFFITPYNSSIIVKKSMEYPEEESEEEEYEEQNINAMRLQKCEKKSKDLWNVITDFIINTKQAKFEQKIGKFWY